ncbi:MAG: tetratricopeptide repeat protein [Spirochaetota bacterium]
MHWVGRARDTGIVAALIWGSAFAVLAGSLLSTVTRLRMAELRDNLQSANEKSDDLRNVALLSRVALINQRALSGGREDAAQYRQEAESALITIKQTRGRSRQLGLSDRLALPFLNGMNRILGLPRLKLGKTPEQELVLDLAFQFESFREYGKAVRGYTVYLTDFSLSEEEKDFALLHRGFCHAMQNHFESAVADFAAVEGSASRRNAETARRLSQFLKDLRERIRIIESVQDPARRGELYYEAAAYAKALENFAQVEANRRSARIRFLTARSLEETGQSAQALAIYRDLVSSTPDSPYALNANRRMYLLGTFLGHDEKLAEESRKNSETVVKDKEFIAAVTHLEKSASQLHAEAAAEKAAEKSEIAAVEKVVLPETAISPPKPETIATPPQTPPQPETAKPVERPTAVPAVPDLRNAGAAQRAESLSVERKEDLIRSQKEKIDKLTMIDGNIFYGVAYRENQDSVWLFTVLGNLELKKADIRAREKVSGSAAIK